MLPRRDEDILKVGFSRDPRDRFHTLHRRFFELFDLVRGLLIQTDHLRDTCRIERKFVTTFSEHRAPAPLVVRQVAGGYTEWLRGVSPMVDALARKRCADQGFALHSPLRDWLREDLADRDSLLYGWSARMLEMLERESFNVTAAARSGQAETALRDTLDACAALGMKIQDLVCAGLVSQG